MLMITSTRCSTNVVLEGGLFINYQSAASSLTATLFRLQTNRWLRIRNILSIVDTDTVYGKP
jgi:hypothetical protein